jgi:outer membrane lipoprotein-sorting protein
MKPVLFFITALCLWMQPASAQNAADILAGAASVCKQPGGISASFAIHTRSPQQSESFKGTIHIKGDRFALITPGMKTWYDGTTQWTYMEHTGEVNITEPEGDELRFTNPAILLDSYQKDFTAAGKGESTAGNGKAAFNIELAPRKKTDVVKVELQIEKQSGLPARITVQSKNNTSLTIQISDVKTNANHPDSFFTFPKAEYPHAEIIDLRL